MKLWYEPSTPREIEAKPWLSLEATLFLKGLLMPEWKILEHGSGGSTLWFAGLVAKVTAIEADPAWYEAIVKCGMPNVKMILWKQAERSMRLPPGLEPPYDLMLVDGEPIEDRDLFLREAGILVKPGGWVVLDNCNRPEYRDGRTAIMRMADRFQTINSQNGQYLNTEFYHLS